MYTYAKLIKLFPKGLPVSIVRRSWNGTARIYLNTLEYTYEYTYTYSYD